MIEWEYTSWKAESGLSLLPVHVPNVWRIMGEVWCGPKSFFYHTCHERELMAALCPLTADARGRKCRIESSNSCLLHVEFPPSWLKYQHIDATFPPTRAQSFNNLQNEGGRWEAIKVTHICLISDALPFTKFSRIRKRFIISHKKKTNSVETKQTEAT